ncbi:MAG: YIP1 family protein [Tabrizicola sp.]|nr:YIP1 family protein [Tabrizicola sp.]
MAGNMDEVLALGRLSLENPRKAARVLVAMDVPVAARTAGLLLVAVASTVLSHIGFLIQPPTDDPIGQFIAASPFRTAAFQWLLLSVSVLLIYRVGRMRGGSGSMNDALLVVVWLQVLMLGLQLLQVLLLLISPVLAAVVGLAGIVLFLWLLTNFVAELHGFQSLLAVFGAIVLTGFAVAFLFVFILAMFFGPEALAHV